MPAPSSIPDISVTIVSFNTKELLRACLRSLFARRDEGEVSLEVIVADNGSTDGSNEMIREEFPEVLIVDSGGNVGYGRGNNLAAAHAKGRYLCIFNSDAEAEPGALRTMRDYLDENQSPGMVGPQLIYPDGSDQPSYGIDPRLSDIFWEQTFLRNVLPRKRAVVAAPISLPETAQPCQVNQVCGACFFVRREAWDSIHGFDPAYFMYFEDVDFCIHLRRSGWPVVFLPAAKIKHHLGASSSKSWRVRALMIASYNRSRYYFFRREGWWQGVLLKFMVVLGAFLRLVAWSVLTLLGRKNGPEQVRLFTDVLWRTVTMPSTGSSLREEFSEGASGV